MIDIDGVTYTDNLTKAISIIDDNIKELTLPKDVKIIVEGAFANSDIRKINFNDNLERIKYQAISCTGLEELYIKNNVTLEAESFADNFNLKKIYINSNKIPEYCFEGCGRSGIFANIELVNTRSIERFAFAQSGIEKIVLPSSLAYINEYAFCETNFKGKVLILPENLKMIGNFAFEDTNLTDIYIPDNIESVGNLTKSDITLHMSEKTIKRLKLENTSNIEIASKTIDNLLDQMSFKELNKKVLQKDIILK